VNGGVFEGPIIPKSMSGLYRRVEHVEKNGRPQGIWAKNLWGRSPQKRNGYVGHRRFYQRRRGHESGQEGRSVQGECLWKLKSRGGISNCMGKGPAGHAYYRLFSLIRKLYWSFRGTKRGTGDEPEKSKIDDGMRQTQDLDLIEMIGG